MTPKSATRGEKLIGVAARVGVGRLMVWLVAFAAWAVRVPGPVPVRTMLHSSPAPNSVGQLCEAAKPVTESCRLLAATEPRLRNVMFGDESTENASDGPEESVNLAR